MFVRGDVYGMVAAFGVRVKDEREQDRNHLVEVTFELPLPFDLADEISPAVARDLFQDTRGEMQAKPEIQELVMALAPALQIMRLRTHPDLEPEVTVAGVGLRRIRAKKTDAGSYLLTFLATWTLADPKEVSVMVQRLKLGVYLTFQEQQPKLDLDKPADQTVDGQVVNVDPGGNVVALVPKRGRGRPKKTQPVDGLQDQPLVPVRNCPACSVEIPLTVKVCPVCNADVLPALEQDAGPDAAGPTVN